MILDAVSPDTVDPDSGVVTLAVTGSGFGASAVIDVGGVALPTTYVYAGQLTGPLDTATLTPGPVPVVVRDGADVTGTVTLTVTGTPTTTTTDVTWIVAQDVIDALGTPPNAADVPYLDQAVNAANAMAFRRRQSAGYIDDPAAVPDGAVKLGTVMYAVARYRERGSADGFPSFEDFSGGLPPVGGTWGEIRRLWAVDRPQVDQPPAATATAAAGGWRAEPYRPQIRTRP